jgi:predicted transcriptional regulator YheO
MTQQLRDVCLGGEVMSVDGVAVAANEPKGGLAAAARPTSASSLIAALGEIVGPLAEALGPDTEVFLHDLSRIPNSMVALGGNVTGRTIGGPMTDLLLRHLRQGNTDNLMRYRTQIRGQRTLRSSTIFVKDDAGQPVACLRLNTDVTGWSQAHELLGQIIGSWDPALTAAPLPVRDDKGDGTENFMQTVEELTATTVRDAIDSVGVPVDLMQKRHKAEVVRQLDAVGLFLIRDAVDYVAQALGVSRYTIYNYLSDLRPADEERPSSRRQATTRRLPLRSK